MTFELITGDDQAAIDAARTAALAQHAPVTAEQIDLTDQPLDTLIRAVRAPSLFAAVRLLDVRGFETVTADGARKLSPHLSATAAIVATGSRKPHPAVLAVFGNQVHHQHHAAPSPRELPGYLTRLARDLDVQLPPGGAQLLADSGASTASARRTLTLCADAGLARPDLRQLTLLTAAAGGHEPPWPLTRMLASRELDQAIDHAGRCDIQMLVTFLVDMTAQLCAAAEGAGDLAALTGKAAWQLSDVTKLARTVRPARALEAHRRSCGALLAARGGGGEQVALSHVTVTLHLLAGTAAADPSTSDPSASGPSTAG